MRTSMSRARIVGGTAAAAIVALALGAFGAVPASAAVVTHTIADVQGTGAATPIPGTVVTIEAVITADYRNATGSGFRGFYVQTAGSTGAEFTPGASDGLFVFASNANPGVAIGDLVRITGSVSEFNGQTQITASNDAAYELVTPAVGVPAPTLLPNSVVDGAREQFEGMLVTPESAFLSSTHTNGSFGSVWLNVGALAIKGTELADAGPDSLAIAAANKANRLLVDDGFSIRADSAAHVNAPPYLTADTVVRNGDQFNAPPAGMVLGWSFNDWQLEPQVPLSSGSPAEYAGYFPSFTSLNPRTDAPEDVGGDIQIAAFNVFNYFTTFGGDARGAANEAEFAIQQSKIVATINALDADVIGLQEIENSVKLGEPVDEALAHLVGELNAAAGSEKWAYVPTPPELQDAAITDFITSAIIYQPASVTPVGPSFALIDETVWNIAREPLAQTFQADGSTFTVIANHFKSKSAPAGNPPEPADLQGFFNAERVAQAESLLGFVAGIQADPAKGEDVVLLGDFNSYAEEDPPQKITDAGFIDLHAGSGEFTYTFDGELGSLDHVFVSPSLVPDVTGHDVWTINSPEWSDRGYFAAAADPSSPFRSSDHDPSIFGLNVDAVQEQIESVTAPTITGQAKVGKTLTATGGTWSVDGVTLAYQWNRDGAPITGATTTSYKVTATDVGADLTVTVTASKVSDDESLVYADGVATSAAKSVAKGDSSTSAKLSTLLTSTNGTVKVTVDVDGQYGIQPGGTVKVLDGRTVIATGVLGADGKVTITLPKFGRGIHLVTVQYEGSDQLKGSTSFPSVLLVW